MAGEIGEIKKVMSVMRIIYPEVESKLLEFKSRVPKFEALIKTAVAFANASGGQIIIGVDDTTREIIGITDEDRAKIYNDFPNSLYDSVQPTLIAEIYERNFNDHSILIIDIPISPKKPYFLKNIGVTNGTYIRVGSSTRKATQEYIEDLIRESQRINFDEEILPFEISILSKELLHDFYGAKITTKRLLADKIINHKHANKDKYAPTVAAILMFCETPEKYIPESVIRCTRFNGIEGREIIYSIDIAGTLEQQADESLKIVSAWLTTDFELEGAKLKGKLPVPKEAIREAIINALLHRKYSIPGAIKIAMFDDRLEIFSPGCFPGLVDINTLGDGTRYLRNPNLARLAYQMKLIETRGTGIRLIYESCRKAEIKEPIYHEEGDFVKIIFSFEPDVNKFKNESDAIISFVKMRKSVSAQQIEKLLSVSRNTALRKLNILVNKKLLKKSGKGPMVKYVLYK